MYSSSMRRRGRGQWRYIVGLSVLGFLIIASAAHAGERHEARAVAAPYAAAR